MSAIVTLVKSIFQKESLQDCSIEELQNISGQYSYFAPVQFLLAEKLRSGEENLYAEQLQNLSLHFSNPLWLDYLLNGYKSEIISEAENAHRADETTTGEGTPEHIVTNEEINIKSGSEMPVQVGDMINESQNENINSFDETTFAADKQENIENSNEEINIKSEPEIPVQMDKMVSESQNENVNSLDEAMVVAENSGNIEFSNQELLINRESGAEIPGSSEIESNEPQISILPLPDLKPESAETELTFEPYHTVDYFASQGVKFVPEEKPADRFGRQLKSFTEWLKTMKRLPQMEAAKISDTSVDEKVQQLADHSINEDEIVTETMAEVWLKQGNKEKAIETYNKLSLLNPGKSVYFASLIEQLKDS
jgi:hypothetical protein